MNTWYQIEHSFHYLQNIDEIISGTAMFGTRHMEMEQMDVISEVSRTVTSVNRVATGYSIQFIKLRCFVQKNFTLIHYLAAIYSVELTWKSTPPPMQGYPTHPP